MAFEQFWRWLKQHANCILRAGSPDVWLFDQEAYHWHLEEDPQHNPTVQLFWGKNVVGEMVLATHEVLYVQATPDAEGGEPGQFVFEVVASGGDGPAPLYHFLLAHGFDDQAGHPEQLKH